MSVAEQFQVAWTESSTGDGSPELLPDRLSRACVDVLAVRGAGISVMDVLRVPVGASDHTAAAAERLQSTTGEGPCLFAHASQRAVIATETAISQQWPAFYVEFVGRTPYRSAASLPLAIGRAGLGALDLYFQRADDVEHLDLADAVAVADQISAVMSGAPSLVSQYGVREPAWLSSAAARERLRVWQAIGRIGVALALPSADALSMLRAHAYVAGRDLDDVAADVVSGELPTDALRA